MGFIVETLWFIFRYKKIEWRKSLIYEPIIPIYGAVGLIILLICRLLNIKKNMQIFIVGFIVSTLVEFISSILQEKIFGTISWDYSKFPLNLDGRINILYSVLFGIASVLLCKYFLFPLADYFFTLNLNGNIILIFIITVLFFIYDAIISYIASFRMKERKNNIKRTGKFWNYIDKKYNDKFLKYIYPNAIVV